MAGGEAETSQSSVLWLFAGLTSAFPNIETADANTRLSNSSSTSAEIPSPICKILQTSNDDNAKPLLLTPADAAAGVGLKQQVLIFQYRGKFHAVDHQCPHRSFPLSHGTLYDIEDFGIKLSVGLTCPKHGWAFDVYTGESDRGAYRLKVWDVEIRSVDHEEGDATEREVWIRQRGED